MTIKRQVFLSITGLFIMIFLLVGVSYSFFSYSEVPENNNISTGNMIFNFDRKDIILNKQLPISYYEAKLEEYDNPNNNSLIIDFELNGYNTLKEGMNYKIVLSLDSNNDKDKLLDDSIIYAQIEAKNITPGYSVIDFGENEGKTFGARGEGAPLSGINEGKELNLLIGNIHTAAPDAYQNFEVRIWIDSSKVIVSDTINRDKNNKAISIDDPDNGFVAASENDVGKLVYRLKEFNEKMTVLKIKAVNE